MSQPSYFYRRFGDLHFSTMSKKMMPRRRFGRTKIEMPVFSCGGMRYQMNWQDQKPEKLDLEGQANLEATIHRSLEIGINHIETARGYGTSEYQLGRLLPNLPRDSFILQTKVGPQEDPKAFLKDFETSMSLLEVEYVDLLGLHGINDEKTLAWSLRKGGCLDQALELKKQGRVRHIGFSTHGPPETISAAIQDGRLDYVNLHWYYIYQRNGICIDHATEQDMGVFIISPNDKGGLLYKPSPKLLELCAPYSPMVFNDLFCLHNEKVHTLSLGAAQPSDFDEHLKVPPLLDDAVDLQPILQKLEQAKKDAVGQDFYEHWEEGLPEWHQCPGGINLRIIIWLYLLERSFDMMEYAKMRYNLLGNGGHWFPGQKATPEILPEINKALSHYPYREQVVDILKVAMDQYEGEEKKRLSSS